VRRAIALTAVTRPGWPRRRLTLGTLAVPRAARGGSNEHPEHRHVML